MEVKNISDAKEWFAVLQTSKQTQTAVMTLEPGGESGPEAEAHKKSEQVLLLVKGQVEGEIAGKKTILRAGDVVIIPAGIKHRFTNRGKTAALTFNVYAPPEYAPGTKG